MMYHRKILFLSLFRQRQILKSAFPAKAVRTIEGWKYVPVMCTNEMDVPGALPLCIRVLMHVNTEDYTKRNCSYLSK